MSNFSDVIKEYDNNELIKILDNISEKNIELALSKSKLDEYDLLALLSVKAKKYLKEMADISHNITVRRFGKTVKLYAPLYLSNDCVNSCVYCGFNRHNNIDRISLTEDKIRNEIELIAKTGIKNIILVSGDNKVKFTDDMLIMAVKIAKQYMDMVSIEVRSLDIDTYHKLYIAGADGFTMFQESYLKTEYPNFHPAGPKADYEYRLNTPDRAAIGGLRNIGLGALLGLTDYRLELFYLNIHTRYLMKSYPSAHVSSSFPRLKSAIGGYHAPYEISDSSMYQGIFSYRLFNNDAGINISTREKSEIRDKLIFLGATIISAGSKTEPGGYSKDNKNAEQFSIDDDRSVDEVIAMIRSSGYDPVMKDWQETSHKKNII